MSLRKNMLSSLVLTGSSVVFPLITFPYVTHTLSAAGLGKYFFADSLAQYFIMVSAVGIPYYGIREIARLRDDAAARSALMAELLIIQLVLSFICSLLLLTCYRFIPELKHEALLIGTACLGILSSALLMEWFYQGMEQFGYITKRSLVIKSISVCLVLLLVQHKADYHLYYLVITLVITANAGLNFGNYLNCYNTCFPKKLQLKRHIRPLLMLFAINVSVSIYAILDTSLLGILSNATAVSYYNVPLKLSKIHWSVVNGAGMVIIPRIAGYHAVNDTKKISEMLNKSFHIVLLLTIPFAFLCFVFPAEILNIIAGKQYLPAAGVLQLLGFLPFIIAICNLFGTQFLMPTGREKHILHATIAGLIVSFGLNLLLVPARQHLGAAIACLAAETTVCIYVAVAALKKMTLKVDPLICLNIAFSLLIAFFVKILCSGILNGLALLALVTTTYLLFFFALQMLVFKAPFITSLLQWQSQVKLLNPLINETTVN